MAHLCGLWYRNPTSMGLWGQRDGVWYRVKEYYYNSREEHRQKTDEEYADDLTALAGGRSIQGVVVDPGCGQLPGNSAPQGDGGCCRLTTGSYQVFVLPPGC